MLFLTLITIACYPHLGFGQGNQQKKALKKAIIERRKGDYNRSIRYLKSAFNFETQRDSQPATALRLMALNYQALKMYHNAVIYNNSTIKRKYAPLHKKILHQFEHGDIDELDIPKHLLEIYYDLAIAYSELYFTTKEEKYRKRYYPLANRYLRILEEKDYAYEQMESILANIALKKRQQKRKENTWRHYFKLGAISWQEKLDLNQSGVNHQLVAVNRGFCLGGGLRRHNYYREVFVDGCLALGSANIGSKATISYQQNNLPVRGALLQSGYLWRLSDNSVSIGPSLSVFYRNANYQEGDNQNITAKKLLAAGASLYARWELQNWALSNNIGKVANADIFLFNIEYHF